MLDYYRNRYKVRLGLLPTRRNLNRPNLFNRDYAITEKKKVEEYLKANSVDYVNLDFLNEEGLLFRGADAEKVVERFRGAEGECALRSALQLRNGRRGRESRSKALSPRSPVGAARRGA